MQRVHDEDDEAALWPHVHDFGHNRSQMSSNVILIRLAAGVVFGHRNGLYSASRAETLCIEGNRNDSSHEIYHGS